MNRSCLFNKILPFRSIDSVIIGEILSDEPDDEFVGKLVDAKNMLAQVYGPVNARNYALLLKFFDDGAMTVQAVPVERFDGSDPHSSVPVGPVLL